MVILSLINIFLRRINLDFDLGFGFDLLKENVIRIGETANGKEFEFEPSVKGAIDGVTGGAIVGGAIAGPKGAVAGAAIFGTLGLIAGPKG